MGKRLTIGLILILSAGLVLWTSLEDSSQSNKQSNQEVLGDSPNLNSSDKGVQAVELGEYTYLVAHTNPIKGEEIGMFLNLDQKETASDLYQKNNCRILVNSGFYDKDNTPIGLFIEDYETISKYQKNNLFDAIFSINSFDTPRITRVVPEDSLRYAVQSGPLLIENAAVQQLKIRNDKNARRNIAAVLGTNEVIFLSIFDANSKFSGPLLSSVPQILEKWMQQSNILIADAINLDGGSASAFITPTMRLTEISPIGSYFCVR